MQEKNNKKIDLFNYPVKTICIILGLYFLSMYLGLDFGQISRISVDGIEFREKQAETNLQAMLVLSQRITEIEKNQEIYNENNEISENSSILDLKQVRDLSLTETVDSSLASLSFVDTNGKTFLTGQFGYIWLGNYNQKTDTWKNMPLKIGDNLRIKEDDIEINAGEKFRMIQNRILRKSPVGIDTSGHESIGVIPVGTLVSLCEIENVNGEYWVKIKVEE